MQEKIRRLENRTDYLLISMVVSFTLFLATIAQGIKIFNTESFSENINIRIPDGIHLKIIPGQYRHATYINFNTGNKKYTSDLPSKIYSKNINSNNYITKNVFFYPYFKTNSDVYGIINSGILIDESNKNNIYINESNDLLLKKKKRNILINNISMALPFCSFLIFLICILFKFLFNKTGKSKYDNSL